MRKETWVTRRRLAGLGWSLLALALSSGLADEASRKSYPVLSGVGIALREDQGELVVGGVLAGSPAERCGLIHRGDVLVAVETGGKRTALRGKTVGDAASLIRGPSGTELVLALKPGHEGAGMEVKLIREPLAVAGSADGSYQEFIGKPAPEWQLSGLDGKPATSLPALRGKIVVLDFWASWCPSCYAPVAALQDVIQRHGEWDGEVEVISVSVDSDLAIAAKTVEKQGWDRTRNLAIEFDRLHDAGVTVVPVTIIVAQDGTIATMAGSHAIDVETEVKALRKGGNAWRETGEP